MSDVSTVAAAAIRTDYAGAVASSLCAAHCLVCAVAPGVLSAAGIGIFASGAAEWTLLLTALVLAGVSAYRCYRAHRSGRILVAFGVSAAALVASRVAEELGMTWGPVVALTGGFMMAAAHIASILSCRRCRASA